MKFIKLLFLLFPISICGCTEGILKGKELEPSDVEYIRSIGLLDVNEEIIYYSSNFNNESSGNFLSDKRIASYWIYGNENKKHFAYYKEIDSINVVYIPKENESTSRIEIFPADKESFYVYIEDSKREQEEAFVAELERRIRKK